MKHLLVAFLSVIAICACTMRTIPRNQPLPSELDLTVKSPDSFLLRLKTTKGDFTMKAVRSWSPLGVDRLYLLAQNGYYNDCVIYRVAPTASFEGGFVVQFGIGNDTALNRAWEAATIPDEPVVQLHKKGSVNFARGGANTRNVQLAISLTPAAQFDTVRYSGVVGFPVVAEVTEGLSVLEALNRQYGNSVFDHEDSILKGREYFDRAYPGLDRILSVSISKKW